MGRLHGPWRKTLLQGAASLGAEVEFGDASAKARIYNSATCRPATLFVVTREGRSTCGHSADGSSRRRRTRIVRALPSGTHRLSSARAH